MAYSFNIPSSRNKLRLMRKFVTDVLNEHGVSEVETNMMVLAVDEVCANIVIHGHPDSQSHKVRIDIRFKNDGIGFDIIDQGDAFDLVNYKEPALEELIKNKHKGGIGIMLVKKIMDDIQFESTRSQNKLSLFKKVDYKV